LQPAKSIALLLLDGSLKLPVLVALILLLSRGSMEPISLFPDAFTLEKSSLVAFLGVAETRVQLVFVVHVSKKLLIGLSLIHTLHVLRQDRVKHLVLRSLNMFFVALVAIRIFRTLALPLMSEFLDRHCLNHEELV